MRIWSVHPQHLDTKGLLGLWRETLLAKHVLLGKTKGYKNHPQLIRFKSLKFPVAAIDVYLQHAWLEANKRGYKFDKTKIDWTASKEFTIPLNIGQLSFETEHLRNKIIQRGGSSLKSEMQPHPIFTMVEGDIESWEKL